MLQEERPKRFPALFVTPDKQTDMSRRQICLGAPWSVVYTADCRRTDIRDFGHAACDKVIEHVGVKPPFVPRPDAVASEPAIIRPAPEGGLTDGKVRRGLLKGQKRLQSGHLSFVPLLPGRQRRRSYV
jgi:hypothetical protein